jgi:pilus assembly protein Flp/PilA
MLTALKTFAQDESGATAIEYGLFTGFLAIGLTMFLSLIGSSVGDAFTTVSTQLLSTVPGAAVQILPPDPA